jgi:SAM-dependent methyltransferase
MGRARASLRRGAMDGTVSRMGWYERWILPRVLDTACGMKAVSEQRAKIVGLARGVVLEPGIGGGLNLPFYEAGQVSKLIGVDPSIELGNRARARSAHVRFPVELHSQSAEIDAVEPGSVDTVVFTYTLCTVPDPARVLAAANRALRPGGVVLFVSMRARPTPQSRPGSVASSRSGSASPAAATSLETPRSTFVARGSRSIHSSNITRTKRRASPDFTRLGERSGRAEPSRPQLRTNVRAPRRAIWKTRSSTRCSRQAERVGRGRPRSERLERPAAEHAAMARRKARPRPP